MSNMCEKTSEKKQIELLHGTLGFMAVELEAVKDAKK